MRTDISHPKLDPKLHRGCFPNERCEKCKAKEARFSAVQEWRSCPAPDHIIHLQMKLLQKRNEKLAGVDIFIRSFFCFRSDEFDGLNVFFSLVPLCKFYDLQRSKYWIPVVKNKSDNVVLGPLVGMLRSSLRVFLSLLWSVPSAPRMINFPLCCASSAQVHPSTLMSV